MNKIRWTEAEKNFVFEHAATMTDGDIAKFLTKTSKGKIFTTIAIERFRNRNGIKKFQGMGKGGSPIKEIVNKQEGVIEKDQGYVPPPPSAKSLKTPKKYRKKKFKPVEVQEKQEKPDQGPSLPAWLVTGVIL